MTKDLFPILYSVDLTRAIRFYRDLMGFEESYRFPAEGEPAFVTLRWGSASLGIGTYEPTPGLEARDLRRPEAGRGFELCVYVEDVDRVAAGLRAAGAELLVEPADQPWGERLAYVRDPDGNTVMLTAPLPSAETP